MANTCKCYKTRNNTNRNFDLTTFRKFLISPPVYLLQICTFYLHSSHEPHSTVLYWLFHFSTVSLTFEITEWTVMSYFFRKSLKTYLQITLHQTMDLMYTIICVMSKTHHKTFQMVRQQNKRHLNVVMTNIAWYNLSLLFSG